MPHAPVDAMLGWEPVPWNMGGSKNQVLVDYLIGWLQDWLSQVVATMIPLDHPTAVIPAYYKHCQLQTDPNKKSKETIHSVRDMFPRLNASIAGRWHM